MNITDIKSRLADYRKWLRLSQYTVAQHLGIKKSTMSALESSTSNRGIEVQELVSLCHLFMCTPNDILGFKHPTTIETPLFSSRKNNEEKDYDQNEQKEIEVFYTELAKLKKGNTFSKPIIIPKRHVSTPVAVEDLLKSIGFNRPPIDVYSIAVKMGISVKFSVLTNLAGALIHKDEKVVPGILLNSNQPENRIRFSLAHEVAHFCLGHYPDQTFAVSSIEKNNEENEREADNFASELLMPDFLLKQDLKEIRHKEITEIEIFKLSDKYLVSYQAMLYKLYKQNHISKSVYEKFKNLKVTDIKESLSSRSVDKIPFNPDIIQKIIGDDYKSSRMPITKEAIRKIQELSYEKYAIEVPLEKRESEVKDVYEDVVFWLAEYNASRLKFELDSTSSSLEEIKDLLLKNNLNFIDKTPSGGCLWIIDAKNVKKVLEQIKQKFDVDFLFTENGSKATKGLPGWYSKINS